MTISVIGLRIRALRRERGLSQADVAKFLGFKDRQTVSAIENGLRKVSADELLVAAETLDVPPGDFTDRFHLGDASWRRDAGPAGERSAFEHRAERWIAAFRELSPRVGRPLPLMRNSLRLHRGARPEVAPDAGERFAASFGLGDAPAERLIGTMERDIGILVLLVDLPEGVSSAACRTPDLDTVLIARRNVEEERNLGLARELFCLLAWEAVPPRRSRRLADAFAAAVLIPASSLGRPEEWSSLERGAVAARIAAVAAPLRVPRSAVGSRLVGLGMLKPEAVPEQVADSEDKAGRAVRRDAEPPAFSRPFMEVLGRAIDQGQISARRAARLLDRTVDDLNPLFAAHDVGFEVEL